MPGNPQTFWSANPQISILVGSVEIPKVLSLPESSSKSKCAQTDSWKLIGNWVLPEPFSTCVLILQIDICVSSQRNQQEGVFYIHIYIYVLYCILYILDMFVKSIETRTGCKCQPTQNYTGSTSSCQKHA